MPIVANLITSSIYLKRTQGNIFVLGVKGKKMSDLISRQAAIDAIEELDWYHQNKNKDMVSGANSSEHQAWYKADDIYKTLEALPSTDAIPIEWIRKWASINYIESEYDVSVGMIEDWRKENEMR